MLPGKTYGLLKQTILNTYLEIINFEDEKIF